MRRNLMSLLVVGLLCSSCSRSNNLLLGRVEAKVGEHKVEVTDCYRLSAPQPQQLNDSPDGQHAYAYVPCRDAAVMIRGEELTVNGKRYGLLKHGDVVTVDHGKVLINEREASVVSEQQAP
jgi:hypothetical protein